MDQPDKERNSSAEGVWRSLWRPPHARLDAFAAVLAQHWRAARDHTSRLFGSTDGSWLKRRGSDPHHLTRGGRLIR